MRRAVKLDPTRWSMVVSQARDSTLRLPTNNKVELQKTKHPSFLKLPQIIESLNCCISNYQTYATNEFKKMDSVARRIVAEDRSMAVEFQRRM